MDYALAALSAQQVAILVVIVMVLLYFAVGVPLLTTRYKRCPSNRALVIYGRTGTGNVVRILRGGAAFVVPLVQDFGYLNLEPIQVGVPGLPPSDVTGFNFELPSSCTVAIGTDDESMQTAATRLLGLSTDEIRQQVTPAIRTEILTLTESQRDRGAGTDQLSFAKELKPALEKQLKKFGLQLIGIWS